MAIYDFDGTTYREIGKSYDFDGTTYHQHGKIYDFDGTTYRLLYQDKLIVIQNSAFQNGYALTPYQTNWLGRVSGTWVAVLRPPQASAGHYVCTAYVKLPTSQFSSMTIGWSANAVNAGGGGIEGAAMAGLVASLVWLPADSSDASVFANASFAWVGNSWGGKSASSRIIDISSLTTDYYLELATYQYAWGDGYPVAAEISITQLILE